MKEKDIESYLKLKIESLGAECPKWGFNGWPDRIVIYKNNIFFIEFKKAKTGRLSELQKVVKEKLEFHGHKVWIIDSKEKAMDFFNHLLCFLKHA